MTTIKNNNQKTFLDIYQFRNRMQHAIGGMGRIKNIPFYQITLSNERVGCTVVSCHNLHTFSFMDLFWKHMRIDYTKLWESGVAKLLRKCYCDFKKTSKRSGWLFLLLWNWKFFSSVFLQPIRKAATISALC